MGKENFLFSCATEQFPPARRRCPFSREFSLLFSSLQETHEIAHSLEDYSELFKKWKKVKGKEWENRFIIALSRIFICWRTKNRGSPFIFQKLTGKHQFSAAATDEFPDNRFAAPLVVVHLLFFSSPQHEFLFFGESVVSTWAAKCSAFKSERRSLVENKSTPSSSSSNRV